MTVHVVRKAIKNLHLGVYPPAWPRAGGRAFGRVSDDAVRLAVIGKLGWIKRQRARFQAQPRQSEREMVSGESHYFLGRRYRLRVVEHKGAGKVVLRNTSHHRTARAARNRRRRNASGYCSAGIASTFAKLVPPLIEKWQGDARRSGRRTGASRR